MAGTVALSVRAWLVDLLGNGTLPGVSVHYSWPGLDDLGDPAVWFGAPSTSLTNPVMRAGKIKRDEVITLPMWISVHGEGMEQYAADVACFEVFERIEDVAALTANVTARDAPLASAQQVRECVIASWECAEVPFDQGNGASMRVLWRITSRSL